MSPFANISPVRSVTLLATLLILLCGCGSPAPIAGPADNLLVGDADLSGIGTVDPPSELNSMFGAANAAEVVVHPGADADVYVSVFVYSTTSDAQSGYEQLKSVDTGLGFAEAGSTQSQPALGDESFTGFSPDNRIAMLWRTANVVVTVGGVYQHVDEVFVIASEQSDKINKAKT